MPESRIRVVIVGGGPAAFEAARTARKMSSGAEISLYTREELPPYRRPALSRALFADPAGNGLLIKPPEWYGGQNIDLHTGSEVAAVDRERRELRLADGRAVPYDRLLLATGGRCFMPPLPGIDLPGVFSLREHADLPAIRRALAETEGAVTVVGGGLLGLELCGALRDAGLTVRLIEGNPVLLGRQLPPEDSELVRRHLAGLPGLELRLGAPPAAVLGDGRVEALRLADGTELPAGTVFFSTGMRPNAELAARVGLDVSPAGIRVDRFLRTADPDVFAAGDCAAPDGRAGCGLYAEAVRMGAAAGANLIDGGGTGFLPETPQARLIALGVRLAGGRVTFGGPAGGGGAGK